MSMAFGAEFSALHEVLVRLLPSTACPTIPAFWA
jgi:hypothetical protein